jgi:hypothetical protein
MTNVPILKGQKILSGIEENSMSIMTYLIANKGSDE